MAKKNSKAWIEGYRNGKLVGQISREDGESQQDISASEWLEALPDDLLPGDQGDWIAGCNAGYADAWK